MKVAEQEVCGSCFRYHTINGKLPARKQVNLYAHIAEKALIRELLTPEAVEDAAKFSSFAQRFKVGWWKKEDTAVGEILYIPEKVLDDLALIAWEELKKQAGI